MPLEGRLFLGTTPSATTFNARSSRYTAVAIQGAMPVSLPVAGPPVVTQAV